MNQNIFFLLVISLSIASSCQQNQAEQILQKEIIRSQEEARSWVQDHGFFWYNVTTYEMQEAFPDFTYTIKTEQ